jgi:carbonic anhydrase/acetyltransferase-like protein (isoleucine patch superfamily)
VSIQEFNGKRPKLDQTVYVASNATIVGDVEVGSEGSIWPNAVIRGDSQTIRIGRRVNIQDNVVIHSQLNIPVIIGDDVTIGHSAILHGCKISNNVLIGMGAIILDGSNISNWVLVGAGTLVTPNTAIPSRSLVLGVPGKVTRQLNDEEIRIIKTNVEEYVDLAKKYKGTEKKNISN